MLSILDLKPRPEEKPASIPAQETGGSVQNSARSLNTAQSDTAQSDTAQSGTARSPEPPPVAPPEPVKRAAQPEPSATAKGSEAAKSRNTKARTDNVPVSEPVDIPDAPAAEPAERPVPAEEGEFEIVLGRRQIASWLFVGTVLIAGFSAVFYFVGKQSAPNCVAALADQTVPYVAPPLPAATIVPPGQEPNLDGTAASPSQLATPASGAAQSPVLSAGPAPSTASVGPAAVAGSSAGSWGAAVSTGPVAAGPVVGPVAPALPAAEPPIFAQPQPGALYLQMGALDKGIAVVLAEGLRKHGFTAFVAPGPNEKIFRVLIGPLANQEGYKRAKAEVDAIDLSTFARRFQR